MFITKDFICGVMVVLATLPYLVVTFFWFEMEPGAVLAKHLLDAYLTFIGILQLLNLLILVKLSAVHFSRLLVHWPVLKEVG